MSRRSVVGAVVLAAVIGTGAGCGGTSRSETVTSERGPLPGGGEHVHYRTLPDAIPIVRGDLRIGAVEGDPNLTFGDVRVIDAGADGTIYVLDYIAREIRAFGPDGTWLRTVARGGEGPGEITRANGLVLIGDSLLWVQDHGSWNNLALSLDGTEVARVPMHVRAYGYMWEGAIDEAGRIWKESYQTDQEPGTRPEDGLHEVAARVHLVSFDPGTEARDSVFVGAFVGRTHVASFGSSTRYLQIPFEPRQHVVVDPGGSFWIVAGARYEIVRLDAAGDTTLIITADVPPPPVTDADRERFIEQLGGSSPAGLRGAEEALAVAPEVRPAIAGLAVDDLSRLWVRRSGDAEQPQRRYDVFDRNGAFVMSVLLDFPTSEYLPIRVRHGQLYALSLDELEVPYIVRAPVPSAGDG